MTKILLVEDNEMNRDMLSRRLIRKGYEVLEAIDGRQGIEMAEREQPDLILMDLSLPEIDGWEATRRIKQSDATRRIPVIALTAHAMSGDKERALQAGCDDFDTKPVDWNRLLSKMQELLGGNGSCPADPVCGFRRRNLCASRKRQRTPSLGSAARLILTVRLRSSHSRIRPAAGCAYIRPRRRTAAASGPAPYRRASPPFPAS